MKFHVKALVFALVVLIISHIICIFLLINTDSEVINQPTLKNLSVDTGTLSPKFNKDTTSYVVSVDFDNTKDVNVSLSYQKEDNTSISSESITSAKVSKSEPVKTLKVIVVADDNVTKNIYTINVVMTSQGVDETPLTPTSCTLDNLSVSEGVLTPAFDKDVTSYYVLVDYSEISKTVVATPSTNTNTVIDSQSVLSQKIHGNDSVKTLVIIVKDTKTNQSTTYTITLFMTPKTEAEVSLWDGSAATSFKKGDGSEGNPYNIGDGKELKLLSNLVNSGDSNYNNPNVYYKLSQNIKLNETSRVQNWSILPPANSFTPIGNSTNGFIANFDGDEYQIEGLYINSDTENVGLFGVLGGSVKGGVVQNVTIVDSYIEGKNFVGGVVGMVGADPQTMLPQTRLRTLGGPIEAWVLVSNCMNYSPVTGNNYVGGIVGAVIAKEVAQVVSSVNHGTVNGYGHVGGVVGYIRADKKVEIVNCINTGNVRGSQTDLIDPLITSDLGDQIVSSGGTGGIVGTVVSGVYLASGWIDINNCFNVAIIVGKLNVGGIVGYSILLGGYDPVVNCYNLGDIIGETNVGGIGGEITATGNFGVSDDYVLNNFNAGNITGVYHVGGIVGSLGASYSIINCYNIGKVEGNSSVGGILGLGTYNKSLQNSKVINSYYLIQGSLGVGGGANTTVTDCSSFDTTGTLTTAVYSTTSLLQALNQWVNNPTVSLNTCEISTGGKYLHWTGTTYPTFIPWPSIPSA